MDCQFFNCEKYLFSRCKSKDNNTLIFEKCFFFNLFLEIIFIYNYIFENKNYIIVEDKIKSMKIIIFK